MTRQLILLGLLFVLLGGGVAALDNSTSSDAELPALTEGAVTTPTATTVEPEPEATATPEPVENRRDCNTIRGTDYFSQEERRWFLANCVRG